MELLSRISISSMRRRISSAIWGSAVASGTISVAAGGSRVVVTASISLMSACACWRIVSDMGYPLLFLGMDAFARQPVAQHPDFDIKISAVIHKKGFGPGGKVLFQIIQKRKIILAHLCIAVLCINIGKF